MRLQTSKYFCYAETAGRSGGRLCWRATCQGITRCSSSRRCAWDGKLNTSRPSHNIGLIDCPCLKKRIFNAVVSHGADYLNQNGRSPFAAEPRHSRKTLGKTWYKYDTKEIKGLDPLTGRAIIQFEKKFRNSYLRGEKYVDMIYIREIREQRMTIGNFPGYNRVLLTHQILQTIVRENNPSWKSSLSNVAGVYLVIDNLTGKLYVGSAYGGEGIWQRWCSYASNGHGGNKELRQILKLKGNKYCEHFQYSILEVFDLNTSEDYAFSREVHWKNVLLTRKFGYNKN